MAQYPFNDYVTIEQYSAVADAIGGQTLTWATLRSIWARVEDLSVKEYVAADEPQARRMVKVRCYWDDVSDVTAKMRVAHGSRTLQIDGIIKSPLGDRAVLMCVEMTT